MSVLSNGDTDTWLKALSEALGGSKRSQGVKDKKIDAAQKELFARTLAEAIPQIIEHGTTFADAQDFRTIKRRLERLIKSADELRKMQTTYPVLMRCASYATQEVVEHKYKGYEIDFEKIHDYLRRVWLHLDDTQAVTSTPNKNNVPEMLVCQAICDIYESIFNNRPSVSPYDLSRESGDVMDGTRYERVCRAVAQITGMELSWSTMRAATKNYKNPQTIKRMNENVEKYSILDELPFE